MSIHNKFMDSPGPTPYPGIRRHVAALLVFALGAAAIQGCGASFRLLGYSVHDAGDPLTLRIGGDMFTKHSEAPKGINGAALLDYEAVLLALKPKMSVTDSRGGTVLELSGLEMMRPTSITIVRTLPPGIYHLHFSAACQPTSDQEITVTAEPSDEDIQMGKSYGDASTYPYKIVEYFDVDIPSPARRRRFTRGEQQVELFPDVLRFRGHSATQPQAHKWVRDRDIPAPHIPTQSLPPNTEVEILRDWPDESGGCTQAVIRVVDMTAFASPGQRAKLSRDPSTLAQWKVVYGTNIYLVSNEHLSESASGPTPSDIAAEDAKRQREVIRTQEVAKQRDAASEIENGKCSQANFDALQQIQSRLTFLFNNVGNNDGFKLLKSETIVATPAGTAGHMDFTGQGELHVFAIGASSVQLDVRDPQGYELKGGSIWQRLVETTGLPSDARGFQANQGNYSIKVRGTGCVLLMYYLKFM